MSNYGSQARHKREDHIKIRFTEEVKEVGTDILFLSDGSQVAIEPNLIAWIPELDAKHLIENNLAEVEEAEEE